MTDHQDEILSEGGKEMHTRFDALLEELRATGVLGMTYVELRGLDVDRLWDIANVFGKTSRL